MTPSCEDHRSSSAAVSRPVDCDEGVGWLALVAWAVLLCTWRLGRRWSALRDECRLCGSPAQATSKPAQPKSMATCKKNPVDRATVRVVNASAAKPRPECAAGTDGRADRSEEH